MTDPSLPHAEFAFPGPLRDSLVASILSGTKTTTTSLLAEYAVDDDPLPVVGRRQAVIDSTGRPVVMIETVQVDQVRLDQVPSVTSSTRERGTSPSLSGAEITSGTGRAKKCALT